MKRELRVVIIVIEDAWSQCIYVAVRYQLNVSIHLYYASKDLFQEYSYSIRS